MSIEATIKLSLAESIANFGYPVGMGLPPPDEALDKMSAALLAALGETHVVVPREPTTEMLDAAIPFPEKLCAERDSAVYTGAMRAATVVERLVARQRYVDMIAALTSPKEKP